MIRVAKFLHGYLRHPVGGIEEEEVTLQVNGRPTPATLMRAESRGSLPGWIVLHGITVPGRHHAVLVRFARALASSGAAVIIPEVTAWRELRLDVRAGDAAILGALQYFGEQGDIRERINLVGFSFGATQALMSAARPGIREQVRRIVGFGGYCDLGRTLRCMITGEHEWRGINYKLDPDPYGRWIVTANYLRGLPEYAHMRELTDAAHELAAEAGRIGAYAADSVYDAHKMRIRKRLPPDQREVWDLIAAPSGARLPERRLGAFADRLVGAAMEQAPELDPRPWLPELDQRIVLAHGHDDRLIPFTETLRLKSELPRSANVSVSITRLFSHSREAERLRVVDYPAEIGRYFALLNQALQPA